MPVMAAVKIMWLQPGAAVGWTWTCSPSDKMADLNPADPPPLYFWFIPLAPRGNHTSLSVSHHRTYRCDNADGWRWRFEWQITNPDVRVVPLKINIWTPLGAKLCHFTS